jgi:hypothetical protein
MPPRVVKSTVTETGQELARSVRTIAGFVDDPLGYVRVRWGAFSADSRVLTMQVVDRVNADYPPRLFKGYGRPSDRPDRDGRWVIAWYLAATEFGTPINSAVSAYTAGKELSNSSGFYLSETDASGSVSLTVTKVGGNVWIMAGLGPTLLRSRGIDWTKAPADPVAGESGAGGSGSGDIIVAAN